MRAQVYDTTAGAAPAPPALPPLPAPTVLNTTSENFDGPGPYLFKTAQFGGTAATFAVASGVGKATVTIAGTQSYYLQLVGPSITLDVTKKYTITATLTANPPTNVQLLWLQEAPIKAIAPKTVAVANAATIVTLAGVAPLINGLHHVQVRVGSRATVLHMAFVTGGCEASWGVYL